MVEIRCENAWVEFPIRRTMSKGTSFATIGGGIDSQQGVVRALLDITLELKEGDRLGIVGHNGAGKSTLLRLLAGVYTPTRGYVKATGRVATLFNSTPGMNIDGSGRENIIICGLYLGLPLQEITAKTEEIVEFAELGPYIDLPVRTYSSGMLMRLGFSIATAVVPEVLLLDEGLATGDAGFTHKAQAKMNELIDRSSILVLASHSESFVQKVCNRCIILEHGRILGEGEPGQVVDNYRSMIIESAQKGEKDAQRQAYILGNEMATRGEHVPEELEMQGLRYALSITPKSEKMWRRFISLHHTQGKPVPLDAELRYILARADSGEQPDALLKEFQDTLARGDSVEIDRDILDSAKDVLGFK